MRYIYTQRTVVVLIVLEIEKNEAARPDVSFASDCSHRQVLFDSIGIRPGDDGGNEQNGRVSEDEPVR